MRVSVAAIKLSIPRYHIDYWRRTGLLPGEAELGFFDLRRIQFIWECRNRRIGLRRIRRMMRSPDLMTNLSLASTDFGVCFRVDGVMYSEPELGQLALIPYDTDQTQGEEQTRILALKKKAEPEDRIKVLEEAYAEALATDDKKRLLRVLAEILKLQPAHPGALIERGNLAFDEGRWNRALAFYEEAAKKNPDCVEAVYNTANAYFKQGKYAPAIRYFQESIRLDPDFPESHFNLAVLYLKLGHGDPARAYFEAYLELDPDSEWSEQARQFIVDIDQQKSMDRGLIDA
ncbi:MAG: tetratricopeptide repeat protein [Spirochaetia bacterium]|nr:tetratricopeptide repeat protein [Spirochaetia bacterium]